MGRKNIIILQESLDKLNEKIKMYKRQLEEQESISNSNIMRVKKFQRELETAENRAEEAESTLNQFRSRERVFAAASVRNEKSTDIQETEVVVKKTINKVNVGAASSSSAMESSSNLQRFPRRLHIQQSWLCCQGRIRRKSRVNIQIRIRGLQVLTSSISPPASIHSDCL